LDKKVFSEIGERLIEVNKIIAKLDPSIRIAAFDFLKSYISGGKFTPATEPHKPLATEASAGDVSDLIQKHGDGKPHQNINLLAAIWFSEFGSSPFSLEHLRERAESTGLTIPASPRMTLKQAKDNGKKLYGPSGRGLFKPTVIGEAFFKTTYGVKKGTKSPPPEK
jgi:hypothetical protein